jgi:hypothetical protein
MSAQVPAEAKAAPDEAIETLWPGLRRKITDSITKDGQCVQIVYLTEGRQARRPVLHVHDRQFPSRPAGIADPRHRQDRVREHPQAPRQDAARARQGFADEELVSIGGKFPVRMVDAGVIGRTKYATFVGIFYGTQN